MTNQIDVNHASSNRKTGPAAQDGPGADHTLDAPSGLDAMFHRNPIPMWIYDSETLAFLEVNAAAVAVYGYTRDEFLNMTIEDIRPPEEAERLHAFVFGTRLDWVDAGVWRHRLKDGRIIYVRITAHEYIYRGRAARFVLAVDVTEQKRMEVEIAAALARAKRQTIQLQRVNRLAEKISLAAPTAQLLQQLTDEARNIVGAHQSVTSLTIDHNWSQSINAVSLSPKYASYRNYDTPPHGAGIYTLVCRTNQPMRLTQAELEAHPAWKNFSGEAGKHPPMNGWLAAPLVDRAGTNIGLIQLSDKLDGEFDADDEAILMQIAHMASNILDNAQLYAAHQASEQRITRLYRLSRRLAALNDRREVMQYVIEQACEMLDAEWGTFVFIPTEPGDISDYEYALAGFPEGAELTFASLDMPSSIGEQIFGEKKTLCVDDITSLDLFHGSALLAIAATYNMDLRSVLAVPVVSDGGKTLGGLFFGASQAGEFAMIHRELAGSIAASAGVTLEKIILQNEIKQHAANLERRVTERTRQLERANAELEAFTYSVSHDLRAPLRAIDGFSQILLQKYSAALDQNGAHYLSRIRAGTERMGQLIDDLLELSRVNRTEMTRKPVDLSRVAASVVTELHQTEPERNICVEIADSLTAQGDEHLLQIVVRNLLDNAWKFTSKTDDPVIKFRQDMMTDGRVTFVVSDNGAGFDMTYRDKLFGVFQRLHRAAEFPGTGVGLATVQRIIHRHGGEIWAEGAPDHGATFWFTLQSAPSLPPDGSNQSSAR